MMIVAMIVTMIAVLIVETIVKMIVAMILSMLVVMILAMIVYQLDPLTFPQQQWATYSVAEFLLHKPTGIVWIKFGYFEI